MYKSLEHIIREIKEGKCCCDKKKDSLEGTIRKVQRKEYESSYAAKDSKPVDEDVAGLAGGVQGEPKLHAESGKKKTDESVGISGTDKFQGNQFKSVRTTTPHIAPPGKSNAGREPQAPENVSRQRTLAKEKSSMTMQGKVNEGIADTIAKPIINVATPYVVSTAKALVKYGEKALKAAPKAKTAPELEKPSEKLGLPAPETKPEIKIEPKTEVSPKSEPKLPEVKTKTETKPEIKIEPKTEVVPVQPKVDTKPVTKVEPKTQPLPAPIPSPEVGKPPAPPSPIVPTVPPIPAGIPKIKRRPQFGARVHARPIELTGPHAPVKTSISRAEPIPVHKNVYKEDTETRKEIENMPRSGDRKKIEYVGRKDSDPKTAKEKTSRQAELKNKIISEGKKMASIIKQAAKQRREDAEEVKQKVYPQVIINPDLKRVDLNVDNGYLSKDNVNQ